jgi:uncharacterized membrane protein YeaQ/YmgE (transglycosylase-associated protein family)
MLTIIVMAAISGLIVGGLGRLLLPGRQDMSWAVTIVVGLVASAIATGVAILFGFHTNSLLAIGLQIAFAVIGVGFVASRKSKSEA